MIIDDVLLRPSTPVSDVSKIAQESVQTQTPKRKKGKKKRLAEKLANKQEMEEISRDPNTSGASETKSSALNSDKDDESSADIKNEFEKSSSNDGRASTSVRTETEKELQKSKKTNEKRFV